MRSTVALGIAASLSLSLVACGPSGGGDDGDDTNPITALDVAPASVTLESIDMAQVTQDFTVRATYLDGSIADVTTQVLWSVSPGLGSFVGAQFVASGALGGVATVTAQLDAAQGTAQVIVNLRNTRVDPSAPANAPDLFAGGTVDPARAPSIVYPPDQVVVPINLGDFDVHWSDGVNDVWEVSLKSAHTDIRVYVGASAPRWLAFTATEWAMAASLQDQVTANVRGVSTALPGVIGEAAIRTAILTDEPTQGGLYYWASGDGAGGCGGRCGIYRHDLSHAGLPAERFYTVLEEPAGRCVACHALSRDGTKMAITYDGGNGPGTILDVGTRAAQPSPAGWNFAAYSPAGDALVTSQRGTMTVRDAAGTPTGTVPATAFATHPDFSPMGTALAYTLAPGVGFGAADWNVPSSQIVVQPYDAITHAFGPPLTVVSAGGLNYYPSISPDGAWVVYNHSDTTAPNGGNYDNSGAELWVIRADGTGTPIKLNLMNIGPGLTNSWARWAPFAAAVNGEPMFWLTVSSKRAFGVRMGGGRPQIWMAGFFPGRAAAGADPTAPAFWLPFQDLTTNNHIAQWTETVIPIR